MLTAKESIEQRRNESMFSAYAYHSTWLVSVVLLVFATLLLFAGMIIVHASDGLVVEDVRYDNYSNYTYQSGNNRVSLTASQSPGEEVPTGVMTVVNFHLSKTLKPPVYMQYRLVGFLQSFRRYRSSRDIKQLLQSPRDAGSDCFPYDRPRRCLRKQVAREVYFPCGAIAYSMFNDSIKLYKLGSVQGGNGGNGNGNQQLICDGGAFDVEGVANDVTHHCEKKGIALPGDIKFYNSAKKVTSDKIWHHDGQARGDIYKRSGFYCKEMGHKIPSVRDEDFIVWASLSLVDDFKKMYRIINITLDPGDYKLEINENYDVRSFRGEKHVVFVTRSWFGEKNPLLGILLAATGALSFVSCLGVVILRLTGTARK
uniref:Uncharacterized protein TCIL3000_11_14160 n=1 Tax=Trypanosoma congolense (strain IL3000) TaxID=1068625 RepID=G0V2M9_TRYCI|nr:unnamed protein product [Trypanosoma congolense IL3000]